MFIENLDIYKMPRKDEVNLTKEQTQRLCELYQIETDLWTTSSKYYHKKEVRTNALERMQEKLTSEYENLQITGDQIWAKLQNLRCYYRKELARVTGSQKSGAGTDEVYESSWVHFDFLDKFLRCQIIQRKSMSNLDVSNEEEDNLDNAENAENMPHYSQDAVHELQETPHARILNKKRKLSGPDALFAEAVHVLSDLRGKPPQRIEQKQEDEADVFGKHVANEMRKISDQRALGLVKIKTPNALFEAQNGIGLYQPAMPFGNTSQYWTNMPADHDGSQNSSAFYASSSRTLFN